MTQTEQLIASLTALDNTGYAPPESVHYFDWSTPDDVDGVVLFEVGDNEQAVQVPMTREDMHSLQQRLTAWLLTNA